jgi:membrane-bound ClpP family serine protease
MTLFVAIVVISFASMALAVNRVRKLTAAMGTAALVGKAAIARTELLPSGWVFIQGERWKATLEGEGHVDPGETVRVTGADGLELRVRKETSHVDTTG